MGAVRIADLKDETIEKFVDDLLITTPRPTSDLTVDQYATQTWIGDLPPGDLGQTRTPYVPPTPNIYPHPYVPVPLAVETPGHTILPTRSEIASLTQEVRKLRQETMTLLNLLHAKLLEMTSNPEEN